MWVCFLSVRVILLCSFVVVLSVLVLMIEKGRLMVIGSAMLWWIMIWWFVIVYSVVCEFR